MKHSNNPNYDKDYEIRRITKKKPGKKKQQQRNETYTRKRLNIIIVIHILKPYRQELNAANYYNNNYSNEI